MFPIIVDNTRYFTRKMLVSLNNGNDPKTYRVSNLEAENVITQMKDLSNFLVFKLYDSVIIISKSLISGITID